MGLFDFFKKKKKETREELAARYDAELDPASLLSGSKEQFTAKAQSTQREQKPEVGEQANSNRDVQEKQDSSDASSSVLSVSSVVKKEAQSAESVPIRQAQGGQSADVLPKRGFFSKLAGAVSKTRMVLARKVAGIVGLGQKIDEDTLEKLEEALIEADVGVDTADMLIGDARKAWKNGDIETADQIFPFLKADLKFRLAEKPTHVNMAASGPTVILVVGVNGSGKTTSIAKLARLFTRENKRVLLAAADTFRAAAVEQLVTWSSRIGCEIVTGKPGADPASVAFTGVTRGVAEKFDIVLIDTAGRLHTQKNLMDELAKIYKVIQKVVPDAPHETVMVLDATTGQNAINQATTFKQVANVTGLFLAKLDGTARGGAILTIDRQVGIPVKFIGLGESFEDIQHFNAHAFVDALFEDTEAGA